MISPLEMYGKFKVLHLLGAWVHQSAFLKRFWHFKGFKAIKNFCDVLFIMEVINDYKGWQSEREQTISCTRLISLALPATYLKN